MMVYNLIDKKCLCVINLSNKNKTHKAYLNLNLEYNDVYKNYKNEPECTL